MLIKILVEMLGTIISIRKVLLKMIRIIVNYFLLPIIIAMFINMTCNKDFPAVQLFVKIFVYLFKKELVFDSLLVLE